MINNCLIGKLTQIFFIPAILAFLSLNSALGQSDKTGKGCEITIREIAADNSGKGTDPELKDIKKDLSKLAYSTFRLEQTLQVSLRDGETKTLELPGKNRLELTPEGLEGEKIRLRVKLSPESDKEKALETILRIPDGDTFLIVGPSYKDGVLIVAFTAKR